MLLRLEKRSIILRDLEEYPKNLNIDIETIVDNYKDTLSRAILENQILNLGILSEAVQREIVMISPKAGGKTTHVSREGIIGIKGGILL
ncbi:hypothetical protein [Rothia aeria]